MEIDLDIEYKLIQLKPIRQKDIYEDFSVSILCFPVKSKRH